MGDLISSSPSPFPQSTSNKIAFSSEHLKFEIIIHIHLSAEVHDLKLHTKIPWVSSLLLVWNNYNVFYKII